MRRIEIEELERSLTAVWVCVDCYFTHHYGCHEHDGRWYAGESDTPCESGKPLRLVWDDDLSDWTCSDHANYTAVCPGCKGLGYGTWSSERHLPDIHRPIHECTLCEGTGELPIPCPHCGSSDDENGMIEFTWSSCQGCGSHLGGSRHRLAIHPPRQEAA